MAHAFSRQTVRKGGKISQKGIHLLLPEVFRAGRVKIQQQKHLHALGEGKFLHHPVLRTGAELPVDRFHGIAGSVFPDRVNLGNILALPVRGVLVAVRHMLSGPRIHLHRYLPDRGQDVHKHIVIPDRDFF